MHHGFRIQIGTVFEQGGPAGQVFPGEIDPHFLYPHLFGQFCRKGIAHGEVLQTKVPAVLQVAGIGPVQVTARYFRHVAAGTGEIGVRIVVVPAILQKILSQEALHRVREGAPEREAEASGIPVMIARALEEGTEVKTEIVHREGGTIGKAWQAVAHNLAVAGIVHRIGADADGPVAVPVDILQVSGLPTGTHPFIDIAQIHQRGVVLRLGVGSEQLIGLEAPDFTQAPPHIIVAHKFVGVVVVFGDIGSVVADIGRYPIAERAAEKHELVFPAQGELVAARAQIG